MELKETVEYKEALNNILNDTEHFVNASRQLNVARGVLEDTNKKMAELSTALTRTAEAGTKLVTECATVFSDDLMEKAGTLLKDIREFPSFTERMDKIDKELENIKEQQEELGRKLDRILEKINQASV